MAKKVRIFRSEYRQFLSDDVNDFLSKHESAHVISHVVDNGVHTMSVEYEVEDKPTADAE